MCLRDWDCDWDCEWDCDWVPVVDVFDAAPGIYRACYIYRYIQIFS